MNTGLFRPMLRIRRGIHSLRIKGLKVDLKKNETHTHTHTQMHCRGKTVM